MPPKETHEIKMMYAVYEDGTKKPIVIEEIKDLTLEEAKPILEEHNFVKVTRCKDCIHCNHVIDEECELDYFECCLKCCDTEVQLDDYCSYGERGESCS